MTDLSSVSGLRGVREALWLELLEASKCIRHWHDTGEDGMIVSKTHVFKLWEARDKLLAALSLPPSPQAPTVSIEAYTYLAHEYCYSNCNEKWNENLEEHDLFCQRAHELLRSAGAQGQVQGGVQASETDEVRRVRQSYRLWDGRAADVSGQEGLREPTNEHELLVGGIVRAALELAILRGDLRMDNGAAFEEMSESEREDVISDTWNAMNGEGTCDDMCKAPKEIADDGEHVCGLTASQAYSLGWRRGNNAAGPSAGSGQEELERRIIANLTQYIHQERVRLSGVYSQAFGAKDVKPEDVAKYSNQVTATLANAIELIKIEFRDAALLPPASKPPAEPANDIQTLLNLAKWCKTAADGRCCKACDEGWLERARVLESVAEGLRRASLERESK